MIFALNTFVLVIFESKWAATQQNQQSDCAPSEDSDQPGHLPSLIRVFAVHMKKDWVLSYPLSTQWRLWSDWVDAQADLSLRWAHTHFVGFVMSRLKYFLFKVNIKSIVNQLPTDRGTNEETAECYQMTPWLIVPFLPFMIAFFSKVIM